MTGDKPVPVLAGIRRGGLLRVGDEEGLALGEVVHAGSGSEGGGVLSAAVQHHDQRQGPARAAGGALKPGGTGAGGAGVGKGVKPAGGPAGSRARGPAREAEIRDTPAGEGAEAMSPGGRTLPQLSAATGLPCALPIPSPPRRGRG